jgi:hypothetical protein
MQHRLTTRPHLGSRRVVILDTADDLEKNAVNALLKSLEEPPAGPISLRSRIASAGFCPPSVRGAGSCALLHWRRDRSIWF